MNSEFRIPKCTNQINCSKAEFLQLKLTPIVCTRNFIDKKVGNGKTKPIRYLTLKTDIIQVGLDFSISNFSMDKTYLANIWSAKKNTFWREFGFSDLKHVANYLLALSKLFIDHKDNSFSQ